MRVMLVGEMSLLWEGVSQVLTREGPSWSIVRATSADEAVRHLQRARPDVAIVQSTTPEKTARDVQQVREAAATVKLVVLGIGKDVEESFLAALEEGAVGFVDGRASGEDVVRCIRRVTAGGEFIPESLAVRLAGEYRRRLVAGPEVAKLTDRELQVVELLARGYSNRTIADTLVISEHTVRAHLRTIMDKLGAENRVQLVTRATREGLLSIVEMPEEAPPSSRKLGA